MSYWQKRQKQLIQAMEKDELALKKRLSSFYDREYRKLDKEIAAYYRQYGNDNVIEYRNLMQILSDTDRQLLFERMEEFARKYPQYAHLMPIRESIYKLNRLEGLQYSIRMQQLEIGAVNNEEIKAYLNKQAMRGVNTAAEVMGFGKNYYVNNPDITRLFVDVPWAGNESFSNRIWNNTNKLAHYLTTDIAQGIARGETYEKLTRQLRERFTKVSRNDAYRLIYTEGTYVMAESTIQPFVEDFQQYRVSVVGDGEACDICQEVAKQIFEIADRMPSQNFPPLHPWCRCTFDIVVEDWDKWMEEYERKHRNGKAEEIKNSLNSDDNGGIIKSKGEAMSLEYQRYGRNKQTLINSTYIDSGEYRNKFDRITNNKDVARMLYSKAKEMLNHRSGTLIEDMYWIDGDSGEVICKVVEGNIEQKIDYSDSVLKSIKDKTNIITLHTHPSSMPPSIDDFNSAFTHNYKTNLIICHDGKVYSYSSAQRVEPRLWELYVQENVEKGLSEKDAQIKALKEIQRNYAIYFEEVK